MRKNLVLISILLIAALMSLALQVQAQVTVDGITITPKWMGFTYLGDQDSYYGEGIDIVAYEENSIVILSISIYNAFTGAPSKQINVSAVEISFDWETGTYSAPSTIVSVIDPVEIPWQKTRTITFNFTLPSTSIATNLYLHSYTITVEHRNYPSEAKYDDVTLFDTNFAVYSTAQADAVELNKITGSMTNPYYQSTRARLLWLKSSNETDTAARYYSKGDFSNAKAHYQTALDLRNQAYTAEESYGVALEELQLKYYESSSNFFTSAGTFMVLFGAALVLFSIGYILKGFAAIRKPSTSPP